VKVFESVPLCEPLINPIVTIGTFDGVHLGHCKILNRIKQKADSVNGQSVVITFNPHPRQVLFPDDENLKLLTTQAEKIEYLEKNGIDVVIILPFTKAFSRMTANEFIRDILMTEIGVKELVIGYDHHFGRNREGSIASLREMATSFGFIVEEIPAELIDEVTVSSTKIRNAINNGDIKNANSFLGYDFKFSGKVVEGKKLGHTLGFATANLEIADTYKIIPQKGVYVVKVKCNFLTYSGVMNIGYRPTIENKEELKVEVHILDFEANIYGQMLEVTVIEKLRDEQKFEGLVQLKEQIGKDVAIARKVLSTKEK
jgi:riboflavin kinase/FMN adenylyltransferase